MARREPADRTREKASTTTALTGPTKRRRGRPIKLEPARVSKLLAAVTAGNYLEIAAQYAGIPRSTLGDAMVRGAKALERRDKGHKISPDDSVFADFSEALHEALVAAEVAHVATIADAARGRPAVPAVYDEKGRLLVPYQRAIAPDWRASLEHLERTAPHRWGRRIFRIEDTGPAPAASASGVIRTYTINLPAVDPLPPPPHGASNGAPSNGVSHHVDDRDDKPGNVLHDDEDQDDHDDR